MSTKDRKRLVLLDSHAILHRAYHALPDFSSSKGEPTGALYGLSSMLIKIVDDLKPDYLIACYDVAGPTYRHEVYKAYKAGRKKAEDDLIAQINRSRDIYNALHIPIYDKAGFEADDILGTIVEQIKNSKNSFHDIEIIIASGDMDTLQLVINDDVRVFTLKKGIKDTVIYDEKTVIERFGFEPRLIPDFKGLRGDASDNIIGIKGIGEKTATTLISKFGSIEDIYKALDAGREKEFEKAGITPRIIGLLKDNREEAEFSKVLATIRRDAPIDFIVPEKTFRDSINLQKIKNLWTEFEFRTLIARLEQVLNGKSGEPAPHLETKQSLFNQLQAVVDPKDLEETSLALWIINSNLTNPTLDDILSFTKADDFESARKIIFAELKKRSLENVFNKIEKPLIPIVETMEERGIKIDRKFLQSLSKDYHEKLSSIEKDIWALAGIEFNINSPKQLGEIIFDKLQLTVKGLKKTEGGARSTRESELEKLKNTHPIIDKIFEYRELAKLLSTYIDAIPPLLDTGDRLHTKFIASGTTTGRMSSQNPNIQNIPIKSDLGRPIRNAFIAEKGYVLASFDYSQIELRIAAFLSKDHKLIDIFKKGEDVHSSVASFVFGVPITEITPEMRRRAKVINFGIIYGMGVLALKQNLGSSRAEAQKFYDDYFKTFSELASYLESVKAETARRGYTETFFGRRRYFEGINSKIPYIKAQAERMAINAPIQGTEADIIKLAMIKVQDYLVEHKLDQDVFPLLQVHDELVYEIREDLAQKIVPVIKNIMESVISIDDTMGVVMKAEGSVGLNWGKIK
jgi:DNA polymerase-1